MNRFEELHQEAKDKNVNVIDYHFKSDRIKGLYCNGTIALKDNIETTKEKGCVLAEELGHYHTTVGNILDQNKAENRKQELHARAWAYNKMIGLTGIINSYEHGCRSIHETADYLNITEEFLIEALNYYKNKYGICTAINNYVIYFEPTLGIGKIEINKI